MTRQASDITPVAHTPLLTGTVSSAQVVTHPLPLDGSEAHTLLVWDRDTLTMTLTAPDGTPVSPDAATVDSTDDGLSAIGYSLTPLSQQGTWTATITGTDVVTETPYRLSIALVSSPITMSVASLSSPAVNETVPVTATLQENGSDYSGATVTATLDGTSTSMTEIAPGTYRAQIPAPATAGIYQVRINATGATSGGTDFAREVLATLIVRTGDLQLAGPAGEEAVDLNGNGAYDRLVVDAPVNVSRATTYRIAASLVAPDGTVIDETGTVQALDGTTMQVTAVFDGSIIRASGRDGPYSVHLTVWATDVADLPVVNERPLLDTQDYAATAFDAKVYVPVVIR